MKRPTTFSELINVIDSKCPLYTGRSISCLRAFMDGWLFGGDPAPDDTLQRFEESLQKKYRLGNISGTGFCCFMLRTNVRRMKSFSMSSKHSHAGT